MSTLPTLPQELIDKILDFSLSHARPDYHSWLSTRLVSRHFKKTVEDYFVAHYLKYSSLRYDYGFHYTEDEDKVLVAGEIEFEKLAEGEGSDGRAVFLLGGAHSDYRELVKGAVEYEIQFETNYYTNFIIQIRRELSDVPPFNLEVDYSSAMSNGDIRFAFDWRSTFTVIMSEHKSMNDAAQADIKSIQEDANAFKAQFMSGQMNMEAAIQRLMLKMQNKQESSYTLTRRQRQKRLLKIDEPLLDEAGLESLCKDNEDRTQKRFGQLQMLIDFEEYSDEEEDEERSDRPYKEDEDESDEWEDDEEDDDDDDDEGDENSNDDDDGDDDKKGVTEPQPRSNKA